MTSRPALPPRSTAWAVLLLTALGCLALADAARAEETADRQPTGFKKILVADFEGPIETITWVYMKRVVQRVKDEKVDCLILRIDSPGGTVYHSNLIADQMYDLNDVHTVAWVPKQAISGACMVAMGCDEIIMKANAVIGDCQPILLSPEGGYEEVGEKAESPLRALFRKYAEKNDYPLILAESFVSKRVQVIEVESLEDQRRYYVDSQNFADADDEDMVIDGIAKQKLRRLGPPIVDGEELLTLTAKETHRFGFQRRTFGEDVFPESEEALLDFLGTPDKTVILEELTFFEKAGGFLLGLAGILGALATLAAAMTIYQGTFSTLSIIGGCALILLILINVTADQLYGFPIFLLALGVLLLAAEAFIIPGFGVAGILGFVSIGAGAFFLATGTSFGETEGRIPDGAIVTFALQFLFSIIGMGIAVLVFSRYFPSFGPGKHMVLNAPEGTPVIDLPAPSHLPSVGDVGHTKSPLRPAGSAEFSGALVDVISDGPFIDAGVRVQVSDIEGPQVTVIPDTSA